MYNENQLKSTINNAVGNIIVVDVTGKILFVNSSACFMFGYLEQELIGCNVSVLSPPPEAELQDLYPTDFLEQSITQPAGVSREVTVMRRGGSFFAARLAVNKIELDNKHVFAGVLDDISREKVAEIITIRRKENLKA